jgi:hypothetical protein
MTKHKTEDYKTAHLLLEKVTEFSSNTIDKGVYKLKTKDNTNY